MAKPPSRMPTHIIISWISLLSSFDHENFPFLGLGTTMSIFGVRHFQHNPVSATDKISSVFFTISLHLEQDGAGRTTLWLFCSFSIQSLARCLASVKSVSSLLIRFIP